MNIAVYGSAAGDLDGIRDLAREVGREIARRGHTLINGACPGLPHEAALGAKEVSGRVIGYSPGTDKENHKERFGFPTDIFDELVYIPETYPHLAEKKACLKYRNIASVLACDAAILIGGRAGTLNEFTLAYDFGKNIGVLVGTGGVTKYIQSLVNDFNKPTDSKIFYGANPVELIEKLTGSKTFRELI